MEYPERSMNGWLVLWCSCHDFSWHVGASLEFMTEMIEQLPEHSMHVTDYLPHGVGVGRNEDAGMSDERKNLVTKLLLESRS